MKSLTYIIFKKNQKQETDLKRRITNGQTAYFASIQVQFHSFLLINPNSFDVEKNYEIRSKKVPKR